ncbi:hypothetical protein ACLOJK_026220 [Asimina triloba]
MPGLQKLLPQEERDDTAAEEDDIAEAEIDSRGRNDGDEAEIDGRGKETALPVQREIRRRCDFCLWLRKTTPLRQKSTAKGETMAMRQKLRTERRRRRCYARSRGDEIRGESGRKQGRCGGGRKQGMVRLRRH